MVRQLLILIFAVILTGCNSNEQATSVEAQGARVIGYRFMIPGDDKPNLPRESGFSLISQAGQLNQELLNELKVKEAQLTASQVIRLHEMVYGDHPSTSAAACYDPHHIFVFYDDDGEIKNTIEICFSCLNIHTSPELEESQWRRHDFRSLARLCDEIGIGMTSRSAEDLILFWEESERLGKK